MWSRWVKLLLTGHPVYIGFSWAVGPEARSVLIHRMDTFGVTDHGNASTDTRTSSSSSSSSSSRPPKTSQWFTTIDEARLSEYPGRHWFYNAGRKLMVRNL
jgi:hypothetical protein